MDRLSVRNVLLKALGLFIAINLLFAVWSPDLGWITAYNRFFPGRARFPFGENSQKAYNLSLFNLNAMFAAHKIDRAKPTNEYRVVLVGNSSVWGTLLTNEQTLAGQLNALHLKSCDDRLVHFYNLGYPTLSLTKDLMVLDKVSHYQPDFIIWLMTLEAFPRDKQLDSPIVANNSDRIGQLITRYGLSFNPNDPLLLRPSFWQRTLVGQRRSLADLFRLQEFGILWAATGIDQEYPEKYIPAQRDFEAKIDYHGVKEPVQLEHELAIDVLDAGVKASEKRPVLIINEPILISSGKNSNLRYNFFYPRWAYDHYRAVLKNHINANGWAYLDAWNLLPESDFTNSAIHITPAGEKVFAQRVADIFSQTVCK